MFHPKKAKKDQKAEKAEKREAREKLVRQIADSVRSGVLYAASTTMSPQEYKKTKAELEGMSDQEILIRYGEEIKKGYPTFYKEMALKPMDDMVTHGVTLKDTAWGKSKAAILPPELNEIQLREIQKHKPKDHYKLTIVEDEILIDSWVRTPEGEIKYIPSDLFFMKLIRPQDTIITIDETLSGGVILHARFIILDDYAERIDRVMEEQTDDPVVVGFFIEQDVNQMLQGTLFHAMYVVRGVNGVMFGDLGTFSPRYRELVEKNEEISNGQRAVIGTMWSKTWYGIQKALLREDMRDAVSQTVKEAISVKGKKGQKDRKVYLDAHYITAEGLLGAKVQVEQPQKGKQWNDIGYWLVSEERKQFVPPKWQIIEK